MAWNQLFPNDIRLGGASYSNHIYTINVSTTQTTNICLIYTFDVTSKNIPIYANHKYLFCYKFNTNNTSTNTTTNPVCYCWGLGTSNAIFSGNFEGSTNINSYQKIIKSASTTCTLTSIQFRYQTNTPPPSVLQWQLKDDMKIIHLNPLYANNPSRLASLTVAQFEEDCFKWFGNSFKLEDEPFCLYDIRNVKINGLKTIGFNQWDNQWEGGSINSGYNTNTSTNDRTTNYIPVIPDTDYYIYAKYWIGNTDNACVCHGYKIDKSYNGYIKTNAQNSIMHIPNNVYYIRFNTGAGGFSQDFVIYKSNIAYDQYDQYVDRFYAIPITSITGKLNGSGNSVVVFPDGMKSVHAPGNKNSQKYDEIINEGGVIKVIRRVKSIDMGTMNWNESSSHTEYYTQPHLSQPTPTPYAMCSRYYYNSTQTDVAITFNNTQGGEWRIRDSRFFNGTSTIQETAATFKSQMNNCMLNYELSTPEIYILDNFTLPINTKIWKSGFEQIVSNESTIACPRLTIYYNDN